MNGNASQTTFASLPNEILGNIALDLPQQDLFNLSLTSRRVSTVLTSYLWRAVRLNDKTGRVAIHKALRARPALAQTVLALELYCPGGTQEAEENAEQLYSDLAFAASLPNLRHLSVYAASLDDNQDRSREAAQALAKLQYLESCKIWYITDNYENWTVDDQPALFSLIGHPSVRQVCLLNFDSRAGVASKLRLDATDITSEKRSVPLRKLSLLKCDIDAAALAQLVRSCMPRELEYCFWHAGVSPVITGLDDAQVYIDAVREAGHPFLERFTFWRDFERDEEVPIHLDGFECLEYLSTTMFALCGADPLDKESRGQKIELSLPPQVKVLEILIPCNDDWEYELRPFLRAIMAYQEAKKHKIQELRFRTTSSMRFGEAEEEYIRSVGAQCAFAVTFDLLPPEWED